MNSQPVRSDVKRWFWFVLVGTLLGTLVAAGIASVSPPGFTARVTLLVTRASTGTTVVIDDVQVAQAYMPTLAELATTRPLLQRVIQSTSTPIAPEDLARAVSTHVPVGTSLLTIGVAYPSATGAANLANAIASELMSYKLPTSAGPQSTAGLKLDFAIVDPARPPTIRDGLSTPLTVALGGAIALIITLGIAFFVENVRRSARSLGSESIVG